MRCPQCGHDGNFYQEVTIKAKATIIVSEDGGFCEFLGCLGDSVSPVDFIDKDPQFECPECGHEFDPDSRETELTSELMEEWDAQGNRPRIDFDDWLDNMADDPQGTLQEAAKELKRLREEND